MTTESRPKEDDVPDTVERLEAARERALRQALRYRAARNALHRVVERLGRELGEEALARAQAKPEYVFRGGYVEDASGDRWWSSGLLAQTETARVKAEAERDEARAEVERLRGLAMYSADVTWQRHHEHYRTLVDKEVAAAYRRGAEAMRRRIDAALAQPVPEDKP